MRRPARAACFSRRSGAKAEPLIRQVHASGISKSIATGLRFGFIAAPSRWIAHIERAIRATIWNTPGVIAAIACAWIEDVTVARLEKQKRDDTMRRQLIVGEMVVGLRLVRHPASYFVWLPMAGEVRADRVVAALARERVLTSTAEHFAVTAHIAHAIRLALGSVDPDTLRNALGVVNG